MLTKRTILSAMLLGRSALTIATGMPTIQEIRTDSSAISAVSGPRRRIMSATLSERKNERPKLPARMSFTQAKYCTHSGSLRPRSFMKWARCSSVSLLMPSGPKIATSGSPGRMRMTTKTMIDTPTIVSAPKANRLAM